MLINNSTPAAYKNRYHGLLVRSLVPLLLFLGPMQGWASETSVSKRGSKIHIAEQTEQIAGPNACGECHKHSTSAWKSTHHFKTFRTLPRKKAAQDIAKRLKIRRIKSESLCLNCHFTRKRVDDKPKVVAGISCESCHGNGRDYIDIHSSFSGKSKIAETHNEKSRRWKKSEANGMIRPQNLYKLAKNCYSCHIVPQENLVNIGQHPAGSDFELVAWSQGEIRHNLWYTNGKTNSVASANRKRIMFVIGLAVELEISLRAVSHATNKRAYALKMARRIDTARKRLELISKKYPELVEVRNIVNAGYSAALKLNNASALTKAADSVAQQTQNFQNKYDGGSLGKLDELLPKAGEFKGTALSKVTSVN